MNDEEIRALVASSDVYKQRHDVLADQLDATAKEKWNVVPDRESYLTLPAFRLFILTGEHIGDVEHEMERDVDAIRQSKKTLEIQQAFADPDGNIENPEIARLNALKPHERLSAARELGLTDSGGNEPVQKVHDPVERARISAEINRLPLSMRIDAARSRGVA